MFQKKPVLRNKVVQKPKENTDETKSQLLMMGYDEVLIEKGMIIHDSRTLFGR
jgi:hypothetical protein